jgi:hypothetical protein
MLFLKLQQNNEQGEECRKNRHVLHAVHVNKFDDGDFKRRLYQSNQQPSKLEKYN